jgi:hypothetical protein
MNKFQLELIRMSSAIYSNADVPRRRANQITVLRELANWCNKHADKLEQRAVRKLGTAGSRPYQSPPAS